MWPGTFKLRTRLAWSNEAIVTRISFQPYNISPNNIQNEKKNIAHIAMFTKNEKSQAFSKQRSQNIVQPEKPRYRWLVGY
jgi:hypothetical protein